MPFIPHTEAEVRRMLEVIGVRHLDALFDEIPAALRAPPPQGVPEGLPEMAVRRIARRRAAQDRQPVSFLGAGCYEHHIPAAVWQIAARGEFYSAYTPYQAEASQGTLQVIYEFQSMLSALTGLAVSNASLYDGATATAEAALMAVRQRRRDAAHRVLVPHTLHPLYRRVLSTLLAPQGIELTLLDYDPDQGHLPEHALEGVSGGFDALLLPQPNFLGVLEPVDTLTRAAQARGALVIGVVNPIALARLAPPGEWGEAGADIACGEGQPLGIPMSSGGPGFGFLTCRRPLMRQLPGRLVGRTVDLDGKPGYTLTLQAREQHIRRGRATSNICTNQGLMATAATLYLALLGPDGLERVADCCLARTHALVEALTGLPGVQSALRGPHFHEAVLRLDRPVAPVLQALEDHGILGGHDLSADYPELGNALLVCATEMRDEVDIEYYRDSLAAVLNTRPDPVPSP
ncbi:aminomethyl-transferring glycine dehydrogenase subunit GcvPA [Alkalilimnicola ehrlichii MLHE-1]|uniref:Probable glycine dehydrogenase (decarboxylating) subunit 1 n=1 Tax=Alkalilimnicola ehrlichii (strain ATCC BAA-1101 / DSM 17681 / MLHE-1) TaxID=187272 RepID=Q0A5G9_ALKEH|nr:aminomethyl-transferring glycine dehydrogenase subunit GcvPA [Alkalilimnicola ehrlichii]ABI57918.1 glycine dehydrogenase (decarboxylating) alpha subunit [Alkalilimnicola ehrlichii MLHE-1]